MMNTNQLFKPFRLKSLELKNRVVMAPMTRSFSPGGVPTSDVADYYARRATAEVGLIIRGKLGSARFMSLQISPIEPIAKRFPALEAQEIVLTFFEPEARYVYVAGNFNNWHTDSTPLTNRGEGEWIVRLLLRSGRYEYRFVVDGRWSEDPQASERTMNPYGDFNSVVVVPLADRTFLL